MDNNGGMAKKSRSNRPASNRAASASSASNRPVQRANGTTQSRALPATAETTGQKNSPGLIVVAALAASVLLFWYYHGLVLNQMTDLSGGITMPDQLILGYGVEHIEALRGAMNADAIGQLNYVHKTAGLMFPLFFALASVLAIGLTVPRGFLRWGLWVLPLAFAVIDLLENNAIDALFTGALDPAAVTAASIMTVVRWALLFLSFGAIVFALIRSFVKTFNQKWEEAGLKPIGRG